MKIKYQVVDIEDIIKYWIKDYEFKDGEELFHNKYYYDPRKGKVVLELCVKEKKECGCCERAGEYNGFGSDGLLLFVCPQHCSCHD